MLTIQNYVRAGSLEEAYALCQKKNNVVLGGMLWLKMQRNRVDTAPVWGWTRLRRPAPSTGWGPW